MHQYDTVADVAEACKSGNYMTEKEAIDLLTKQKWTSLLFPYEIEDVLSDNFRLVFKIAVILSHQFIC